MSERDKYTEWANRKKQEEREKEEKDSFGSSVGVEKTENGKDENISVEAADKGDNLSESGTEGKSEDEGYGGESSFGGNGDISDNGGDEPYSSEDGQEQLKPGEFSERETGTEMFSENMFNGKGNFTGSDDDDGEEEEKIIDPDDDDDYGGDGGTDQVPSDLFGRPATDREDEDDEVGEKKGGDDERGRKNEKVSFAELRNGRKIPRLKKSLVLAICLGGVMGFLVLVNVIAANHKKKQTGFSEGGSSRVERGKVDLSELSRKNDEDARKRVAGERRGEIENDYEYGGIPSYDESRPWDRNGANNNSSSRQYQSQAAVDPDVENERIQRELRAASAPLRKDGGYGESYGNGNAQNQGNAQTSNNPYAMLGTGGISQENRMAQYTELIRAAQGGTGGGTGDKSFNNGSYSPKNTESGNYEYFEDNVIFPGTIIHAVLVSRIDTDYPGPIHARVTENVYDSKTGRNLLIPQGTILQGNYSSASIGIAKVQIAWESMVVNFNGTAYQVSLGGMAGVDKRGRSGIAGTLDDHYFEWLKAAGIISMFTMLNSEIAYQTRNNKSQQVKELIDVNQSLVNQLGDRLMSRALDIQPTVRVANGKAVSVAVNKALVLRPFKAFEAERKYVRRGVGGGR